MYFLIIQLFRVEYKEDLLLALTSCGIRKGSTFEGTNLDKALERDFPLFTGLVRSEDDQERYALLITAVVENKSKVRELIHLLEEADIDIKKESILRMILLPADMVQDNDIDFERKS